MLGCWFMGSALLAASLPAPRSPSIGAGPPFEAAAEEDLGALLLRFKVDGRDRLFFVDSGAAASSYDPRQWVSPQGQTVEFRLYSGSRHFIDIHPARGQGLPLYDS